MSKTSRKPQSARCSEVYFAEVDFPGVIRPRLVVEYPDGLRVIIGSENDLSLAARLIAELRHQNRKGGRS